MRFRTLRNFWDDGFFLAKWLKKMSTKITSLHVSFEMTQFLLLLKICILIEKTRFICKIVYFDDTVVFLNG